MDTFEWPRCDEPMMHQLTAATVYPGHVYPYPTDALQENMQTIPGLGEAYVSGYCTSQTISPNLTAMGEFAAARTDGDTGKGYNWVFAKSSDGNVYYAGPFKDFPEHHWSTSQAVPVEKLFGHSPYSSTHGRTDGTS